MERFPLLSVKLYVAGFYMYYKIYNDCGFWYFIIIIIFTITYIMYFDHYNYHILYGANYVYKKDFYKKSVVNLLPQMFTESSM